MSVVDFSKTACPRFESLYPCHIRTVILIKNYRSSFLYKNSIGMLFLDIRHSKRLTSSNGKPVLFWFWDGFEKNYRVSFWGNRVSFR